MTPSNTPSATVTQAGDEEFRGASSPRASSTAAYLASSSSVTERLMFSPNPITDSSVAVSERRRDTKAKLDSWDKSWKKAGKR
ncbi:hypothetical protein VP1G_05803 [Cytospora mali]|uniref:Uncharacterized protein n=1 Tax=Cytospora mali TaxID=578113 RepID=A0A194V3S7_CYTMA|nr:hypothetical protein VP1G_05803 [Valsa mali var. pyri (nom. inval.)]